MNNKPYSQILDSLARDHMAESIDLTPRVLSRIQKGKQFTMKPQLKLATAILFILITFAVLFFTVPAVRAAIQRWFGYVPGIGLVREGQIRVLAEPVTMTRDGVTVTVKQVVTNSERTVLIYEADAIPASAFSTMPQKQCPYQVKLRLPGEDILPSSLNGGDAWGTGYEHRFEYQAIPAEVNDADLLISCLFQTSIGAAPQDWEIPLHFVPAPPDMAAFPVIEIPSPTAPAGTVTPPAKDVPDAAAISLTLDRAVQMDDGYLLYATLHWKETGFNTVDVTEPERTLHLLDANGQEMLFETVYDENTGMKYDQRKTVFALKTAPIRTPGALTLVLDAASVDVPASASFIFDPGPNPQPGQEWKIDRDVQIGERSLRVVTVSAGNDGYSFTMTSDTGITSASPIDLEHMVVSGGGSSGEGNFSSGFNYADGIPAGPVTFTIGAITFMQPGPWQVQWTPPAVSSTVLPTHPAACLNAASWKQALEQQPQLPQGVTGKVLILTPPEPGSGEWEYYLTSLDGSERRLLPGVRNPALSSDGSKLAYSSDAIYITDLASDQTTRLPGTVDGDFGPVWSPDGSQIVFNRTKGIFDLFVVNADGSNLRRLTDGGVQEWPVGWMPDGQHLVYSVPGRVYEYTNFLVDVNTGESQLFSEVETSTISPDGKYKIEFERVFGDKWAVYISDLDGSNRWMLAEGDLWVILPMWRTDISGSDDQWLLANISNTDSGSTMGALVNLSDCRIIPLPYLKGEVSSWSP